MVYPVKMQVRHSTVLVIVLLLMGSVFYEVTRTESLGRQSAARTQDIALPAPEPVVHRISGATHMDYIGGSSIGRSSIQPLQPSDELIATAGYSSTAAVASMAQANSHAQGWGAVLGHGRALARGHAGSTGFAPGAYGMGGVGAWGGVSGVMRPVTAAATAATAGPKKEKPAKAAKPGKNANTGRSNGNGHGGSGSSGSSSAGDGGATEVAGGAGSIAAGAGLTSGFTTGAASVESGAVANVQAGGSSPRGPAPASTPEPMSLMLVGTGIAALVGVRRRIQ